MPFYWNGEYHVYYLMNPTGNYQINWEHIVSKDLVNWEELPSALRYEPDDPTGPDGVCIFTGDIVEKDGMVYELKPTGLGIYALSAVRAFTFGLKGDGKSQQESLSWRRSTGPKSADATIETNGIQTNTAPARLGSGWKRPTDWVGSTTTSNHRLRE
jgi:hypothetical protein